MNEFRISTFNVRGLTKESKKRSLIEDMQKHQIDICCIQETKTTEFTDYLLNGYRVILSENTNKYYGNGFIISPRLRDNVVKTWTISDRISVLQVNIPTKKDNYWCERTDDNKLYIRKESNYQIVKTTDQTMVLKKIKKEKTFTVINVCAPQSGRLKESIQELDTMYNSLNGLLEEIKDKDTTFFICGDFMLCSGKTVLFRQLLLCE